MAARRRQRCLIVNADDFGQSPGVNRGIIEAHEHGIVTSASLMVRGTGAAEAAAYTREHPGLSLGLHFDFGEWARRDGQWVKLYEVVPEHDIMAVANEASRQFAMFRRLVGKDPSHLDSHQHAHRGRRLRLVFIEIARWLSVPLRNVTPGIHYCGSFYGQDAQGRPLRGFITVKALMKILAGLPPGFTELGCHPGDGGDLDSMYLAERAQEVRALCDPRVRAALADMDIQLCSFHDVAVTWRETKPRRASTSSGRKLELT